MTEYTFDQEEIDYLDSDDSRLDINIDWAVTSWSETLGDYIEQRGLYKEGMAEIEKIFRYIQHRDWDLNEVKNQMVESIGYGGFSLEDVQTTNRVAKKVFGKDILKLADLEDVLNNEDDEDEDW